jgi:6-phosphogluconolactonase/glucosamine-6-phosphate isomerase/deaminase
MLKVKEDEKVAAAAAADIKKDQAKDKRAKDTTALVTTGSEIKKRLEQLGPSELLRLKIDDLHALLVNVDPNE